MYNMSGAFTMIYYYVPEDLDDQDILNGFAVPKSSDVTLGDIRASFPLEGQYHFRFKHLYQKNPVWMDINNDSCKVPIFNGKIIAKATRISWESQKKASAQPAATEPPAPTVQPSSPKQVPPPAQSMNIFGSDTHKPPEAQYDLLFHA